MAVAMIYPDATKYKRGGTDSLISKELNAGYLSQARTVLKWAPEMADAILPQRYWHTDIVPMSAQSDRVERAQGDLNRCG